MYNERDTTQRESKVVSEWLERAIVLRRTGSIDRTYLGVASLSETLIRYQVISQLEDELVAINCDTDHIER